VEKEGCNLIKKKSEIYPTKKNWEGENLTTPKKNDSGLRK